MPYGTQHQDQAAPNVRGRGSHVANLKRGKRSAQSFKRGKRGRRHRRD